MPIRRRTLLVYLKSKKKITDFNGHWNFTDKWFQRYVKKDCFSILWCFYQFNWIFYKFKIIRKEMPKVKKDLDRLARELNLRIKIQEIPVLRRLKYNTRLWMKDENRYKNMWNIKSKKPQESVKTASDS